MCEKTGGAAAGTCMVVLHLGYQWGKLGVEGEWRVDEKCRSDHLGEYLLQMKGRWESNINVLYMEFCWTWKKQPKTSSIYKNSKKYAPAEPSVSLSTPQVPTPPNMWTDPGNIYIAHRQINVGVGTEAAQFLLWECINGIFVSVYAYSIKAKTRVRISPHIYISRILRLRAPRLIHNTLIIHDHWSNFIIWLHNVVFKHLNISHRKRGRERAKGHLFLRIPSYFTADSCSNAKRRRLY